MPGVVSRLTGGRGDREAAEALERALAELDRLRARGVGEPEARREAARGLPDESLGLFHLAVAVEDAASAPDASPAFVDGLEARLRASASGRAAVADARRARDGAEVRPLRPIRVTRVVAAAAACVIAMAALGRLSTTSIPGDSLYRVKRAGETVRLALAEGRGEALLRVDLAESRLEEVDAILERQQSRVVGFPGSVVAAAPAKDPRLAELIESTLHEAARQMRAAAAVLLVLKDREGLDRLAQVAKRGRKTASDVAAQLPDSVPPALETAVALETIETQAVAALYQLPPAGAPGPQPCETPTPAASVEPSPAASPSPAPSPTPATKPTPTPTPSPTPTPTPSPTPCVTPTPTAGAPTPTPDSSQQTPSPSPGASTPAPTAPTQSGEEEPQPRPSPTPQSSGRGSKGNISSSGCGPGSLAVGGC